MPNTTNFNFPTPADTDLVKDGASAIRSLGNSIDSTFVDLKGGTTDQVLAKNSNTDLDFKWVTSDDANAIQNAIVDAKGDLISATAADTPARLAVGANGTVLTADSSEATGLKWAAPAASGSVTKIGSTTTFTAAATIDLDNIFTSSYTNYTIYINYTAAASADQDLLYYLRASATNTTTNYEALNILLNSTSFGANTTANLLGNVNTNNTGTHTIVNVLSPQLAQYTMVNSIGHYFNSTPALRYLSGNTGQKSTTQFDGIRFYSASGATMTGTIRVYGWNN